MLSVGLYSFYYLFIDTFIFHSVEVAAIGYAISISIPWPYFVYYSNKKFIK